MIPSDSSKHIQNYRIQSLVTSDILVQKISRDDIISHLYCCKFLLNDFPSSIEALPHFPRAYFSKQQADNPLQTEFRFCPPSAQILWWCFMPFKVKPKSLKWHTRPCMICSLSSTINPTVLPLQPHLLWLSPHCLLHSSHTGLLASSPISQACISFRTSAPRVSSARRTISPCIHPHGSLPHLLCSASNISWGLLSEAFPVYTIWNCKTPHSTPSAPSLLCSMCHILCVTIWYTLYLSTPVPTSANLTHPSKPSRTWLWLYSSMTPLQWQLPNSLLFLKSTTLDYTPYHLLLTFDYHMVTLSDPFHPLTSRKQVPSHDSFVYSLLGLNMVLNT